MERVLWLDRSIESERKYLRGREKVRTLTGSKMIKQTIELFITVHWYLKRINHERVLESSKHMLL